MPRNPETAERQVKCIAVIALAAACLSATGVGADETILYRQDFEGDAPEPRIVTNSKKYTVHFSGVTNEEKSDGKQSWKLDVSFEDGTYFYLMFPVDDRIPVTDGVSIQADMLVTGGGHAGLGHNFAAPMSRGPETGPIRGTATWKEWNKPPSQWQTLTMTGNQLRKEGEKICAALLTDKRFLGLADAYVPEYFKIEDPVYDAWYINLRFLAGRRAVVYVDKITMVSTLSADEVKERREGSQARFEARQEALVARLETELAALEERTKSVSPADAHDVARLRNLFNESRGPWGTPQNLYEWMVSAAALANFAEGVDGLEAAPAETQGQ